jgi:hypothetical protein
MLQQFSLAVASGSGVLPEVAGVVHAAGQFVEIFGLDGTQEMQADPGCFGDPFQRDATPFSVGREI